MYRPPSDSRFNGGSRCARSHRVDCLEYSDVFQLRRPTLPIIFPLHPLLFHPFLHRPFHSAGFFSPSLWPGTHVSTGVLLRCLPSGTPTKFLSSRVAVSAQFATQTVSCQSCGSYMCLPWIRSGMYGKGSRMRGVLLKRILSSRLVLRYIV